MLLGSLLSAALLSLFGFNLSFVPWLVITATMQAITAYTLTRNYLIVLFFMPGVLTGLTTLFVVPMFLEVAQGDSAAVFKAFFYYTPLIAFSVSIAASTILGVFPNIGTSIAAKTRA